MTVCVCGHNWAAHQEIITPKGFASGECAGTRTDPDGQCTCSYYEHDYEGDQ